MSGKDINSPLPYQEEAGWADMVGANQTASSSTATQKRPARPYKLMRRASTFITDTDSNGNRKPSDRPARLNQVDENESPLEEESPPGSTDRIDPYQPRWVSRTSGNPMRMVRETLENRKVKNVLKCSLAYFISSLVVYTPVSKLYGLSDNKHMVATVATYFNPARTSGSMTEATMFVGIALAYSFFLSVMSMLVSAIFYDLDLRAVGYIIDIVVFCGGGIGSIIFMKQKMGKLTFNTACSVACISLITILTREGHVQAGLLSGSKLIQNFALVTSGIIVSTVLCYTVWPQSAVKELKRSFNNSMCIYSSMLDFITETFINGRDVNVQQFEDMTNNMGACFKNLQKHLSEAKYELLFNGHEKEYELLAKLVASCHRLGAHIDGLTSSAKVQWDLLCEEARSSSSNESGANSLFSSSSAAGSVASLDELVSRVSRDTLHPTEADLEASSSAELFHLFVYHLGPPLRSYSYTVRQILDGIPFEPAPEFPVSLDRKDRTNLKEASVLYSQARARAVAQLYDQDVFKVKHDFDTMADEEGVAASCGNFSYVLEAFGNELDLFIGIVEEYDQLLKLDPVKTYSWIKFWQKTPSNGSSRDSGNNINIGDTSGSGHDGDTSQETLQLHKQTFFKRESKYSSSVDSQSLGYKIWKSFRLFRRTDVQFGIKVGIGAAIFAIPAFLDKVRPVFGRWRGEWGLITYSIIMSKSIGGTLKTVRIRILGTFLGAFIAYITWLAFPENPYVLAFMGWLLSLPCFWIILNWQKNGPFGRFILLTYNITALYSYSISLNDNEDDDDEGGSTPIIEDIAFHRFVSVTVGTLWALFITVAILPNSARKQFKRVLSIQWLRMGLVWKSDPLNAESNAVRGIQGENELRSTMIELQELMSQSTEEYRLKGPYPTKDYRAVLSSTQQILDVYQNLSVLVAKNRIPSQREVEIIHYTLAERREICSRLFLYFYLVSSAMRMGFPLPDKLPSTEHAIDRVLAKLNEYRQKTVGKPGDEEDFVLFYSYILATITIAEELAKITLRIQSLYGVIEDEMLEIE